MGQIKCYNIKYSVEEEDLLANPKFKSIDDLHNSLPKQVIIDHDVKLEIDEIIVNAISDQTGWLSYSAKRKVEGFNWKVEEQTPTKSDNTLEKFMKGEK